MYVHYLSGEANDNHVKQVANAEKDRQISLLPLYVAAAVMFIYCIFVISKSSYRELAEGKRYHGKDQKFKEKKNKSS